MAEAVEGLAVKTLREKKDVVQVRRSERHAVQADEKVSTSGDQPQQQQTV